MNRHTVIVIVSCIVIASTVGYSVLNLVNMGNLQFRWADKGGFNLFSLISGGQVEVCNPSILPITFNSYEISSIYDGDSLGTVYLKGGQVIPKSSAVLQGNFAGDKKIANIRSLFLDTEMGGTDVAKLDTKKLEIVTELKTSLFGVIPYVLPNSYDGSEFFDLMNDVGGSFAC